MASEERNHEGSEKRVTGQIAAEEEIGHSKGERTPRGTRGRFESVGMKRLRNEIIHGCQGR